MDPWLTYFSNVLACSNYVQQHGIQVTNQIRHRHPPFSSCFCANPRAAPLQVCGSGLKAVELGVRAIQCGDAEVVIAGGQESMSLAPHALPGSRSGQQMGHCELTDTMIKDGLWCALTGTHMGVTAENVARRFGATREEQDARAASSQSKAAAAQQARRCLECRQT